MGMYSKLIESYNNIKSQIKNDPTTSNNVSMVIAGEIALISTVLVGAILLRHINVALTVGIIIIFSILMITNMPLMPKLFKEQSDSLDKMMFYIIITLGIIVTLIYWGLI